MSAKKDGGLAFLLIERGPNGETNVSLGMTLRDYFAAKAMQGLMLIADPERADQSRDECARLSYRMADAMLKAREA